MTNALGQQASWSNYNGLGQPGRMTDPNGVATDYTYDAKGNALTATQLLPSGNRVTTLAYNNNHHQPTDITSADGRVVRFRYTASNRLNLVGNALNEFTQLNIDVPTNMTTSRSNRNTPSLSGATPVAVAAGEFVATTQRDSLGRPGQDIGNNGQLVTYGYDNNGNRKTRADVAGRVASYDYDAQNRVTKFTTAPDGGITRYGYDVEGKLASVTDPRNLVTRYTYNGLGDLLTRVSPDTGSTSYSYDTAGRLASETRANGAVIGYAWDKLGRMTLRSAGAVIEGYTYDEGTYGKGHLTRLNDATGQTTYTYAADGQLTQQMSTIVGVSYTTTWSYDAAGRLAGMSYPNGLALSYTYDATGRVSRVASNVAAWPTQADSFLYQPASERRYAWRFGNNLPRTVTQDTDGRITQLASTGVQSLGYGFSTTNTNTITSLTDNVYAGLNASLGYDSVNRLASVSKAGDDQSFAFADLTNRTHQVRQGLSYSYGLDGASNRLT